MLTMLVRDEVITYVDENFPCLGSASHILNVSLLKCFFITFAVLFTFNYFFEGVPNVQLVKESAKVAQLYNNQSVAEQNSIDIAWSLFMEDSYSTFRQTLCPTSHDMKHFRQLVVNSVMATDIVDKNLKDLRNKRWDVAFQGTTSNESVRDQINRKATIVIEHLIQASDVSHTMQHWHVYCKWNEMFYHEMYKAYKEGRAATNPAEFWYKGEIGFFDYYIIPLAKKLKECGVFGVSSDEYLTYAVSKKSFYRFYNSTKESYFFLTNIFIHSLLL